jgi:hypothetical protein
MVLAAGPFGQIPPSGNLEDYLIMQEKGRRVQEVRVKHADWLTQGSVSIAASTSYSTPSSARTMRSPISSIRGDGIDR